MKKADVFSSHCRYALTRVKPLCEFVRKMPARLSLFNILMKAGLAMLYLAIARNSTSFACA